MARALFWIGLILMGVGIWLLLPLDVEPYQNASYPGPDDVKDGEPNYLGWATVGVALLALLSSHYFRLDEKRRKDRAEARDIHDRRQSGDDIR